MATGDRFINMFTNRLLGLTDLRERFLEYLSNKVDATVSAFFLGSQGTLDNEYIGLAADGNDRFKLDLSLANKVGVQGGQFIDIPDETDVSKSIKFENANGVVYYVGLRYAEVEFDEAQVNPKYGNPEYPSFLDTCGEVGAPNLITNTAGVKIAIRIDSITESGVDHSGRTVKVWLTTPVSGVPSVAFYEGTSYYSGGHNYVDIPYSGGDGPLGQDTSGGVPPSTTPGDYRVWIKGVTWRRNTDLSTNADYWFAGTVTGAGAGNPPVTFDIGGQARLFLITLDRAYDGPPPYPGFGRSIILDAGAIEVNTGDGLTNDDSQAQFRLDRLKSVEWAQFMLTATVGDVSSIPIAFLQAVQYQTEFDHDEACNQTGSNRLQFTRAGCVPNTPSLRIRKELHLVYLTSGPEQGLYIIDAVGADYIDVRTLEGNTPATWTAGSRTAYVFRPLFVAGCGGYPFKTISGVDEWMGSALFHCVDDYGTSLPIKILPEDGDGNFLEVRDNQNPTELAAQWMNEQIPSSIRVPVLQIGGNLDGGGWPVEAGTRLIGHPGGEADICAVNLKSQTLFQDLQDQPYHRAIGVHNSYSEEQARWDMWGRLARTSIFEDDLNYFSTPAHRYQFTGSGGRYWSGNDPLTVKSNGGTVYQYTGSLFGDYRLMQGPACLYLFHSDDTAQTDDRVIYFAARFRIHTWNTELSFRLGLANQAGAELTLSYDAGATPDQFKIHAWDGVTHNYSLGSGTPPVGELVNDEGWVFVEMRFHISAGGSVGTGLLGITTDNYIDAINIPNPSGAVWRGLFSPYIYFATTEAALKRVELDYWGIWDAVIKGGPKDKNS